MTAEPRDAGGLRTSRAIILAGGIGSRLGELTRDVPKPVLPIAGEPFLCYLLWLLSRQGIREVAVSSGYLASRIEDALKGNRSDGIEARFVEEKEPLGTGGGVRLAAEATGWDRFFVLNGDTLFDVELAKLERRVDSLPGTVAGMFTRGVADASRYGAISLRDGLVASMAEKRARGPGLVNGGVYLFSRDAVERLPEGRASLEKSLLPQLIHDKVLAGLESDGFFIDIGIPAAYAEAQTELPRWRQEKCGDRRP